MGPRKYLYRGKTLAVEAHSTVNGTGYTTYFKDRKGTRHILLYNDELKLRPAFEEAQADLDSFAQRRSLKEVP